MAQTSSRKLVCPSRGRFEDEHRVPTLDQTMLSRCAQKRDQERCVARRSGDGEAYHLPVGTNEDGRPLRQIAERPKAGVAGRSPVDRRPTALQALQRRSEKIRPCRLSGCTCLCP
jgi:hypothetical protein